MGYTEHYFIIFGKYLSVSFLHKFCGFSCSLTIARNFMKLNFSYTVTQIACGYRKFFNRRKILLNKSQGIKWTDNDSKSERKSYTIKNERTRVLLYQQKSNTTDLGEYFVGCCSSTSLRKGPSIDVQFSLNLCHSQESEFALKPQFNGQNFNEMVFMILFLISLFML